MESFSGDRFFQESLQRVTNAANEPDRLETYVFLSQKVRHWLANSAFKSEVASVQYSRHGVAEQKRRGTMRKLEQEHGKRSERSLRQTRRLRSKYALAARTFLFVNAGRSARGIRTPLLFSASRQRSHRLFLPSAPAAQACSMMEKKMISIFEAKCYPFVSWKLLRINVLIIYCDAVLN